MDSGLGPGPDQLSKKSRATSFLLWPRQVLIHQGITGFQPDIEAHEVYLLRKPHGVGPLS